MSNILPSIDFVLKLMRNNGLDPREKNIIKRRILQIITFLVLMELNISAFIEAIFNWNGIETIEKLNLEPLSFVYLVKLILLATHNNLLEEIVNTPFWPLDKFGSELEDAFNSREKFIHKCIKMYIPTCLMTTVSFVLVPIFTPQRSLIFDGYDICDYQNLVCFVPSLLYQVVICVLLLISVGVGFDFIFVLFIVRGYMAAEMIIYGFQNLQINDKKMFKELVDQHVTILKFIKNFNRLFSMQLLVQYGASYVLMVFSMYMITSEGIPPPLYLVTSFGSLFMIFSFQLFVFCLGGTMLMHKVNLISDAAFATDWWKDPAMRKKLSFVILRCSYGSRLEAGKLMTLDLNSFVTVLRNAFSAYTLLLAHSNQ